MGFKKSVELSWQGKEYSTRITMSVIEKIEERVNLATMLGQCSTGDIRLSHAAWVISTLLNAAGCKVTSEDVYTGMFGSKDTSIQDVVAVISNVLNTIFYVPDEVSKKKPTKRKPRKK